MPRVLRFGGFATTEHLQDSIIVSFKSIVLKVILIIFSDKDTKINFEIWCIYEMFQNFWGVSVVVWRYKRQHKGSHKVVFWAVPTILHENGWISRCVRVAYFIQKHGVSFETCENKPLDFMYLLKTCFGSQCERYVLGGLLPSKSGR